MNHPNAAPSGGGTRSTSPAAQVIDFHPVLRRPAPEALPAPSPYETLAYLAYVLPARIYAANPWLLDPKYQDWMQDPRCQEWLDSLKYPEH
ncbi:MULTISPECIES: hypothetical protein [unclassified Lysobacter]|uniref:hypothetical protein n=1 Tax=unclassified Lysobacter TaxID=2635362 RepID=UPI001BE90F49|nr:MULTISPECIES: hypothetical protein [unclassified Lysobacter]MBT2748286.1 hypothetical protein [Lysobacter sp. ISL-42]MBT2749947.1 hypothetical protein [Lysobacter sp. ISL-50]MBT2781275.1 hypothetical protein [Lysobacter sp. ISL-52]